MEFEQCTLDEVADALDFISADCCRDDWIKIGMAIKSEFGEGGKDTFQNWSETSNKFNKSNFKSSWRSIKQGGRTTIATLFKQAIKDGYKPAKTEYSEEEKQRRQHASAMRRAQREKEAAEEARSYALLQESISVVANNIWNSDFLSSEGQSAYLERKEIPALGAKFVKHTFMMVVDFEYEKAYVLHEQPDINRLLVRKKQSDDAVSFLWIRKNALIVPMFDMSNRLHSLQVITEAGKKFFFKSSKKSGTCFLVGNIPPAPSPICLAEGFATAGSIHLATGLPVFVCWDCGNLAHMAPQIKQAFPNHQILVCGDTDESEKGNPGLDKAKQAAAAANGSWLVPDFSRVEVVA